MAGQSNIEKVGRFDYVEPMNMYLDKPDNTIVYNPEDYNISVNLEVEIPSRFYAENNEVKLVASSDNGSISFFGGTNIINDKDSGTTERGYLTTSWTDISVNNVGNGNKECLGIESINISYSPNFFPIVTIRFVDVRGASLFAAQQKSYEQWVQKNGFDPKNSFDGASFFKALFSMPSPIFKLTVKGFYGKPVTYKLMMSKFSSDFDSENGNFIANVEFIGYMYGVYTELPMSFIALAPYLDGKKYWDEKQFSFDNGVLIPTIPELIELIGVASQKAEQETLESKQGRDYQNSTELLELLQEVKNKFPFSSGNGWFKAEGELSDESVRGYGFNGDVASQNVIIKNGGGFYNRYKDHLVGLNDFRNCGEQKQVYYYIRENLDYGSFDWNKNTTYVPMEITDPSYFFSSCMMLDERGANEYLALLKRLVEVGGEENHKRFSQYVTDFELILQYSNYYKPFYINGEQKIVCSPVMCFLNYYEGRENGIYGVNFWNNEAEKKTYTILYKGFKIRNGVDCSINDIKDIYRKGNKGEVSPHNGDKLIFRIISNIPKWVDEDIDRLTKDVKEKTEDLYKQKIVEEQELLGFPLTIKNFYDIIFAHIDTFMYRFYEHLKNLSDNNYRKQLLTSRMSDICDVPSKTAERNIPPFPTFITRTDNKDEIVWPPVVLNGEDYEETEFVYEILNAALQLGDSFKEAREAIANSTKNVSSYPTGTDMLLPATPYDLIIGKKEQKNPYQEIYDEYVSNANTTDTLKKIQFVFMCRCAYFALMFRKYRTIVNINDNSHNLRKESETLNKAAHSYFAMCEVCNIVKLFGDNIGNLKNTLIVASAFTNFIDTEYVDGMSESSKEGVTKLTVANYGWPNVKFKGDLQLDKEDNKYTVIPIQDINTERLRTSTQNRTCLIENEKYVLFENNGYITTNKLDEIVLNQGSINLLPKDYFSLYESLISGDKTINENENLLKSFSEDNIDTFIKDLYENYLGKSIEENFKIEHVYKRNKKDLLFTDGENAKKYNEVVKEQIQYIVSLQEDKKNFTSYINNMACIDPVNVIANGCTPNNCTVHFVKTPTSGINLRFLKDGANNYAKAYLFLFSIPLTKDYMKAASFCNGQRVLDIALLREGAFYYWQENYQNIKSQFNESYGIGMTRDSIPIVKRKETDGSDSPTLWLENDKNATYLTWEDLVANMDLTKEKWKLRRKTVIPQNKKSFLINYFKEWAQGEGFNDISLLNPNVDGLTSSEMNTVIKLYFNEHIYFDYADVLDENTYQYLPGETSCTFLEENKNFFINSYEKFAEYIGAAYPGSAVTQNAPVRESPFNNLEIAINSSDDLKLSIYLTLQSLYNKFIAGSNRERWVFGGNKSEFKNFLYMDSYYNKIDNKLLLNTSKVENMLSNVSDTVAALTNSSDDAYKGSVYEFFARVCEDNGMNLLALPVQPFVVGGDKDKPVWDLFTTIPYNRMDLSKETSCFISMYTYRPSSHLDLQDDSGEYAYVNDGFDINVNNEKDLPVSLQNFGNPDAPRIPAFAVTYAKQNQSIFKKINVSTSNPQITEASLAMTFNIASRADSNPRDVYFFGQDTYSIYSNYSYTCDVEMMGCAPIMPLMYFQLNNIPMFKGAYMIINVEHNIVAGNMTTRFKGVRVSKNAIPFVKANCIYFDENNSIHYGNEYSEIPDSINPDFNDNQNYTYDSSTELETRMENAYTQTFSCSGGKDVKNYCGRYTYRMANAFITGKSPCKIVGMGNANSPELQKNLEKLGYHLSDEKVFRTTKECKDFIDHLTFRRGDVVVYWAETGPNKGDNCMLYGHAQIYTGKLPNKNKSFEWSSSFKDNYGSSMVYLNSRQNYYNWHIKVFRQPLSEEKNNEE